MCKKVKLIIEIGEMEYNLCKECAKSENYSAITRIITNGIIITDDMISREGMKKMVDGWLNMDKYYHPYSKGKTIPTDEVYDLIDTAPTIGKNINE